MAGALALDEYLAGAVIALMLSGGQALEAYADDRARRELSSLLQRPAVRPCAAGGNSRRLRSEAVRQGDTILVKPGELIPVDGVLTSPGAVVDASAPARPATSAHVEGDRIQSGTVESGAPLPLRATATLRSPAYAGIVRLVSRQATPGRRSVRPADRCASCFLLLALAVARGAWALSSNPVRALAVLVVATPCPLILAAPLAIVSGMSRAAHRGIIVKSGGALETLAPRSDPGPRQDRHPDLREADRCLPSRRRLRSSRTRSCAWLRPSTRRRKPMSSPPPWVTAARDQGIQLAFPSHVVDATFTGLEGGVDGVAVRLGKRKWVAPGALPSDIQRVVRQADPRGVAPAYSFSHAGRQSDWS